MPAGNLTDEDLKTLLALVPASNTALRAKIEADLPAPAPAAVLKLELVTDFNNRAGVEVRELPADATGADFAWCTDANGSNPITGEAAGKNKVVGQIVYPPDATHIWADAHPNAGASSGTWWSKAHGRIKVEAKPAPEPEPSPEPPKPTGFKRGFCAGGWNRTEEVTDAKKFPSPVVRLENPSDTASFTNAGVGVIYLNSGGTSTNLPHMSDEARAHRSAILKGARTAAENHKYGYSSGGVKSLNAQAVAADAVAVLKKHPDVEAYELLNEPGGSWFWGSGAESQENATAYVKLVRAVYTAVRVAGFKQDILVSFDGGHAGDNAWGRKILTADPALFQLEGVIPTNHPYDGSGANPGSTLVRWGSVEETHRLTGKWPDITEYGRPLLTGTGDSPKSTEAQQAAADGAMTKKCKEAGCRRYTAYGGRGDSSPCYAIFKGDNTPRPAVAAIANA